MTDDTPPTPVSATASGEPNRSPTLEVADVGRGHAAFSLVWLVPIVAALLGAGLLVQHILSTGPEVTLLFRTAEGLAAGRTEVRYKEVVVGQVSAVRLNETADRVEVRVRLDQSATRFAVEDARYWVIRPRIGVSGVSGLGTLVSGAYIAVDRGESTTPAYHFNGLETPPLVLRDDVGRTVQLRAAELGSIDIGAPVYFRNVRAGRVTGYKLASDGSQVNVQAFIEAPYDRMITTDTRFWNASGLDVSLGAQGLRMETQSLATVLSGGIAFGFFSEQTDPRTGFEQPTQPEPVSERQVFDLFRSRELAMTPPDGVPVQISMRFAQATRGLARGAPVEFLGLPIGRVTSVTLEYDAETLEFPARVEASIYPQRLGRALDQLLVAEGGADDDQQARRVLSRLVAKGLRAQLRNGNLLTGQMLVALDFHTRAEPVALSAPRGALLEVPTIDSAFAQLEAQVGLILERLGKLRIDEIGTGVQAALSALEGTLRESQKTLRATTAAADGVQQGFGRLTIEAGEAIGALTRTLDSTRQELIASGSPLQDNLAETMLQLQRTAQSVRALTDYLQQHPESLLRGK